MPTSLQIAHKHTAIHRTAGRDKAALAVVENHRIRCVRDRFKSTGARRALPWLEVIVAIGDDRARGHVGAEVRECGPGIRFGVENYRPTTISPHTVIGDMSDRMAACGGPPAMKYTRHPGKRHHDTAPANDAR